MCDLNDEKCSCQPLSTKLPVVEDEGKVSATVFKQPDQELRVAVYF